MPQPQGSPQLVTTPAPSSIPATEPSTLPCLRNVDMQDPGPQLDIPVTPANKELPSTVPTCQPQGVLHETSSGRPQRDRRKPKRYDAASGTWIE
jgi:hypothetical protein